MKPLALLIGLAALLSAAPATVLVTQQLWKADGTPFQGTVAIAWQQFDTGAGEHIPAGTKLTRLSPTGVLSVNLVPNIGATPAGTAYTITYRLDLGESRRVSWIVPASGPVTVTAIETTMLIGPSSIVALSQLGGGGASNGQCPAWNTASGTWVPAACGLGTVSTISGSGPSWLTWTITNPTTTPTISLAPTTGQTSHQVIGTCGAATIFGPCPLVAADLPATTVNAVTNDTNIQGSIASQNLTFSWAGTLAAVRMLNAGVHTGDCITTFPNCTISNSAVTLAKMANLAANSIVCNNTGSPATPLACTQAQIATMLSGQTLFTLTTTGSTGPATYSGGTLNIPQYTGGAGGSVFTGSTAANPAFSATPTFSLADVSVKSPVRIEPGALTANVTAVTFTNKTAGAKFSIAWLQDGTGGRTVTYGASVAGTAACAVDSPANATTTQDFEVGADGATVNGTGCHTSSSVFSLPAIAAPGTPVSGLGAIYVDSTSKALAVKNDAGVVSHTVQTRSVVNHKWISGIQDDGSVNNAQPSLTDLADGVLNSPAAGTTCTLTGPSMVCLCTGTCTVTVPVPVKDYQFCAFNASNVATAITFAALGGGAMYQNPTWTGFGTAGTGTTVLAAAAGNMACIYGQDATHYLLVSSRGGAITVN